MNKKTTLQLQAIDAAKRQDWAAAISYNQALLELDPQDTNTYNRLGVAHLQIGEKKPAKQSFEQALVIDKSNSIARKHLDRLSQNQQVNIPSFSPNQLIEEPGRTRTVELHRLASKHILNSLSVGNTCDLKPKNRYISVEANNVYVGALPEDLSFRLTKLMKTGNEYSCRIKSANDCTCAVFLREIKRSKRNQHINSFPITKNQLAAINDIDDIFLEDDVPIQIVETDNDVEKTLEGSVLERIEE